jgi:hypothetical protein
MTATGLVLSGVGPAAWYLVGAWRRGRRAEPSTPLCSPEDARALETMRQRADAVRRGEIKVASAEEIRERGRRWREETLPLLQAQEYPTLLRDGTVEAADRYCDEAAWIAGIRARAEADGLQVALVHRWSSYRDDGVDPWAELVSPAGEMMPTVGTGADYAAERREWAEAQWGETLFDARERCSDAAGDDAASQRARATPTTPDARGRDGEGQDRTGDTTIFSRVLYQLSYLAGRRTVYRPGVRTRERATASGTVLPLREGRCDPLHQSTFSGPGQVNSPYSLGARSIAISTPTSAAVSSAALPRFRANESSPDESS